MSEYAVHVATTAVVDLSDDEVVDELLERLSPYSAALAAASGSGSLAAQLTVRASSLDAAARAGVEVLLDALDEHGITAAAESVEVMTAEAFLRWLDTPQRPTDLVSTSEAAALLGVSRQRVLQLVNTPDFPEPARIGEAWYWSAAAVRRFRAARDRGRVAPAAATRPSPRGA